jgi:hypothetical protein
MTEEQQDAVVGRVTRESKDADRRLAVLKSEVIRRAEILHDLAALLKTNPENVIFEGDPYSTKLGPVVQRRFQVADIDGEAIHGLVLDFASAKEAAKVKREELDSLTR